MATVSETLEQVSLITANFGDGIVLRDVLNDWFTFLGGRPGQVVLLDNGSDPHTQETSYRAFADGLIDKLVLVKPGHCDTGRSINYIAEITAPSIATKPYLLFSKIDTLPYRQGRDGWLAEAARYLDRDDTFAVGGSFNCAAFHHAAFDGWYFSDKCSENFAFMKRSRFISAIEETAGDYIRSGYRAAPPVDGDEMHYLVELCMERYMHRHQLYTLVRTEDADWTVFHTNVHGERLQRVREKYLARQDVARFMNSAQFTATFPHGVYYGRPNPVPWHIRLRTAFGASFIGPYWRTVKDRLRQPTAVESST